MIFNISTIFLIVLYLLFSKYLNHYSDKKRIFRNIKYYYNTAFFAVLSFFCCMTLQRDLQAFRSLQIDTAGFWFSLISLVAIILILVKVLAEIFSAFKALLHNPDSDRSVHNIVANIVRIILVFTFAYFMIYLLNPDAFKGLAPIAQPLAAYFDLIYFSIVTFATVGFGDISPASSLAKLAVMGQIGLFYIVIGIGFVYASNKNHKA